MNILFRLIIFLLCSTFSLFAQDFQGVATYKTQQKLDLKIDSTQVGGGEMQKQLMEMLKKQFQKTYVLTFDKNTSIYKEDEELAPPSTGSGMIFISSDGGSDVLFKDIKNQSFTNQKVTFGKQFIIKDRLKPIEWELHSDTKNIGNYTCYKAMYTKEIEEMSMMTFSSRDDEQNDEEPTTSPETKTITVTSWYTPQIPVSNGPDNYQGLPGLILEVNDGDLTILCSKITINPKKVIEISEPKKGKQVTQEEYDKIMMKKMEEMSEQYRGRGSDKDGIEIRIGG
ncbi:MAG: GLPGLI family protein [Bacteroidetes bacterium]|nr:GLPGLI family protein [Bacteroidota bacterium]MDA0860553.1 GLPGLI family protein [Bacteroidota bacterium]MDA1318317.1 GLPGLI family protein [Bacteroidota bacterium]